METAKLQLVTATRVCTKCGIEQTCSNFSAKRRANRFKSDATVAELERVLSWMRQQGCE